MGSHNSSSTGRKWLNSGSLKRSWQGIVPFEGFEFDKNIFQNGGQNGGKYFEYLPYLSHL